MKIEKLTDDKIRIIVNSYDIEKNNLDIQELFSNSFSDQSFFLNVLEKAKDEVDFNIEGCKILVEAFSDSDEYLIFTITRYREQKAKRKKPRVKKKSLNSSYKLFYRFSNFDDFCDFCVYLGNTYPDFEVISKSSSLYFYNNNYYLIIPNSAKIEPYLKKFLISTSEFLLPNYFSTGFEVKVKEFGKLIFGRNAIVSCIHKFDLI